MTQGNTAEFIIKKNTTAAVPIAKADLSLFMIL